MESPFRAGVAEDKVALITGGGSGIGLEITAQLARHGAQAAGFDGDVRKQEDAATVERFGKLDILVNNAGGNFLASAEGLTPNGFRTVVGIDTVGTYNMCHEALKYLKRGGSGRDSGDSSNGGLFINISATLQYTAAWYQVHLSAAKSGVDSITRSLALEWGADYDIRVNGIAPGTIGETPAMKKLAAEKMGKELRELMPLIKFGEKWDVAMAAIYLASNAGWKMRRSSLLFQPYLSQDQVPSISLSEGKYVNGATLIVDGGFWLCRPRHVPKEEVKALSKAVEKKVRASDVGVPSSKL